MILIDSIEDWNEQEIRTQLTIRPSCPFFVAGKGVAAHVAMEWMAQSCAAFVGVDAVQAQRPVKIGFLGAAEAISLELLRGHIDEGRAAATLATLVTATIRAPISTVAR